MQSLQQFLESYQISEHLIDQAPQLVFIIGLPAAGKSTFINKYLADYFPNITTTRHLNKKVKELQYKSSARLLDKDVQLHRQQKINAEIFAKQIYNASNEDEFLRIRAKELERINNSNGQQQTKQEFKISTDWAWVEQHKNDSFGKFHGAFLQDFFKSDWAIDFSTRPDAANADFWANFKTKLSPEEYEGLETFNNNDVIWATCGDKMDGIRKAIETAGDALIPSIVYLDMPVETAVEKDEGRRKKEGRGVGRAIIEKKANGLDEVWKYLSRGGFKKEGIYKLLHFKFVPDGGWGHYELEKEYVNTNMIKDYLNR